jgi:hypothetical protein
VDHRIDPANGGGQGCGLEEITFDELNARAAQVSRACPIADEGGNLMAPMSEPPGKTTSDFSGCTGHECFHGPNLNAGASLELEETDMPIDACAATIRVRRIT